MPDTPRPPWTGGSNASRASAQRGDRRVFPPRRPPHVAAADNGRRGEGGGSRGAEARRNAGEETGRRYAKRGVVADREVAGGASADPPPGAGRNAATVAAGGAAPPPPPRGESGDGGRARGGGVGSKRPSAPPAQAQLPPPKRRAVSSTRQLPPASFRRTAAPPARAPLARADADAGSRTRYQGERDNRSSHALGKPTVARPLAARKDAVGVLPRAVPSNAAGTRVLKEPYPTDGAAPILNTGRHGPKAGMVKSFAAKGGGRGTRTDELWGEKMPVKAIGLPLKPARHDRARDGGSKVYRPLESRRVHGGLAVPEEMLAMDDDDSSLADGRAMQIGVAACNRTSVGAVTQDGKLEKGEAPSKEAACGRQVTKNGNQDSVELTKGVMQAPTSPHMRPMTHKMKAATRGNFSGHTKMVKPKAVDHQQRKVASASVSSSKGKLDDRFLQFDDIFRDVKLLERKLELYLDSSLGPPSVRRQSQYRCRNTDARSKFKKSCRMFEFVCRTLAQIVGKHSLKMRIDFEAAEVMKRKLKEFTRHGPIVGQVPGVEVGDEFLYRTQLDIAGIHHHNRKGIATTTYSGMLVAISIVASGGYPDELGCTGELIYTGSGGKAAGKKKGEDQKLKSGNLALKNCIRTKTPVRVIHGFKCQNTERSSHSGAKLFSRYTYDGLYLVVNFWMDGQPGSRMFKFKLEKIPGQPELPMHKVERLKSFKSRPGLCMNDISQGKEATPICVINTVDDVRPAPFQYTTRIRYPFGLTDKHQGCDCTNDCSDSVGCACAVKNGGEIPFDLNGAILNEKPVIFECGPSCKCPPSCHNRVSQHDMKIPLEVFRTTKTGWGVRSLRSIPSGSFICEYIGELLHQKEADKRRNNSYMFDVGLEYDGENVSSGLLSNVSGVNSSCSQTKEDVHFTIDASEYGNIGRFINHSCSPNIQAQNVLWDHDDKRMPHIMFFAAETIPPLQELTYDYNNPEIDRFRGVNTRMKSKICECGSSQCRRRFYRGMAA